MAPKHDTMCCLVFLSTRGLQCTLLQKHVLDKLRSGMSYSAAGQEFNVNESAAYTKLGVSKNTHKTKIHMKIV